MSSKLNNYALQINPVHDIICAYAGAPYFPTPIDGIFSPTVVMGSFSVPEAIRGRLCVIGLNTGPAVLNVSLYGPAIVSGSITRITSPKDNEHFSQAIDLVSGVVYQIGVSYAGVSGTGVVRTVSLVSL